MASKTGFSAYLKDKGRCAPVKVELEACLISDSVVPGQLKTRMEDFLSTLRIGVDLGETAGGIALVHGNRILHAETFVDFHEATLEDRRNLRRGRRTRQSKKMRLARLRSWVLRQKLPDGTRLPDPYVIMANREFQTKPGLYRVGGASPESQPTWIEAAKQGKVDSSGFVCALTHIFQKRGYKYDDKELSELSDGALEDFLNSCCLLKDAAELASKIRTEVETRNKPRLVQAYTKALDRMPEPRKAMPRSIKEQELSDIIKKFGEANGFSKAAVFQWQKELVVLLNRFMRQARFDNRTRSGCSWCGKNTPRLKPCISELSYKAAIGNLRIYDKVRGASRKLNESEKEGFMLLWQHRQSENHKFSRGHNSDIFERAPTVKNLEKIFDQLNVVKSWLRDPKGKPYYGYAMFSQVDNLLNRKANGGRARLCMEHLAMAAEGKSMHDAGLAWQTKRSLHAANPRLEQHDARIIKRIEHLLFIKSKKGNEAWREYLKDEASGKPLRLGFITLEVPSPETQHSIKGQIMQRSDKKLKEMLLEETGGTCIYQYTSACANRKGVIALEGTQKDHIFPQNRGGPDVRANLVACCPECNHPDTGKGGRLPSEWIKYNSPEWESFKVRINDLTRIPDAKKLLLLLPPGSSFPDDPTPLARTGARSSAFAQELGEMFKRYGVPIPSIEYIVGNPQIQMVAGRLTTKFRQAWLWKDFDAKIDNFPAKDRRDLLNHAQDAALVAATPPHTWRDQIFMQTAVRWCVKRDFAGQPILQDGRAVMELRQRPGLPLLELAPDWSAFINDHSHPMVTFWNKGKANWKRRLMKQTFYQNPNDLDSKLKVHEPINDSENISKSDQRRHTVTSQPGGKVVQVPYLNPRTKKIEKRKTWIEPGLSSDAAVLWRDGKGRFHISLSVPPSMRKLIPMSTDPAIPKDAKIIGRIRRGAVIHLDKKDPWPEGFYRIKELSKNCIIVLLENNVTTEIAKKLGMPKEEASVMERKLSKSELNVLLSPKP